MMNDFLSMMIDTPINLPFDISFLLLAGENDVFGDNICHEPTVGQSAVDVIALTYCDLHWIQRDALIEVLEFYPEFANKFTKNLVLSYNLRDEVNVEDMYGGGGGGGGLYRVDHSLSPSVVNPPIRLVPPPPPPPSQR